ncbi:MAG: isoprenyl transferase [Candidatus Omnitrophota bacterium]
MAEKNNLPRHVAFIMDGNGRWAQERGLSRADGHRAGVDTVREIVKASREWGIEVVTFFAFSTENWSRPRKEVEILMRFLGTFLDREIRGLHKNNIRFKVIGRADPLPPFLLKKIKQAEEKTAANEGLILILALNYGSRQEIVDAAKKLADSVSRGRLKPGDINEDLFGRFLYTAGLPDPDLLIRTSGEMRLSNFLLWQLSYAELYFPKKYWPDFKKSDFEKAIKAYQDRERRFGGIDADKEDN